MSIEVRNISKTFGRQFAALKDVSLRVDPGELVALLGPSGSGKTTLLRIIAGLESPDPGSGAVHFNGEDVTRQRTAERRVGFVFQHYALFRHLSVFENVAFGLRVRPWSSRPSRGIIRDKVRELLRLVQLDRFEARYPSQLSGGQRQRVALARALAVEPSVLLLDEPFGSLDAKVRRELRRWLRRLHDEMHITSILVTHDQEEALEVADRVAVMNNGRIEQDGPPEQVYDQPANPFVYNFLGSVNIFRGRLRGGQDSGVNAVSADVSQSLAYVRPHDIALSRQRNGHEAIEARVLHVGLAGPIVRVSLKREDGELIEAELSRERHRQLALKAGETVFVHWEHASVFKGDYSI